MEISLMLYIVQEMILLAFYFYLLLLFLDVTCKLVLGGFLTNLMGL